jgi:hypothetical protein
MRIIFQENEPNIFYVLGISNKELVASNFIAWLLNPTENHGLKNYFLKEFLKLIDVEVDLGNIEIEVIREYFYILEGRNNYIDIVIKMRDRVNGKMSVIGIENKVDSSEGYKQTERYWNILDQEFGASENSIHCIYLTKSNLPVRLSNENFKHIKYVELEKILVSSYEINTSTIIRDFVRTYIYNPQDRVTSFMDTTFKEAEDRYLFNKRELNKTLCEIVSEKLIIDGTSLYCDIGYSAKDGKCFFQIWDSEWFYKIGEKIFNIHLEGDINNIKVHFETFPYEPYSKLSDQLKLVYDEKISQLSSFLSDFKSDNENIIVSNVRSNAVLTAGSYKIIADSFSEYYDTMNYLVHTVRTALTKFNLN